MVESLVQLFDRIDSRNRELGWSRYDWRDLDSHPLLTSYQSNLGRRLLRYAIRGADMLLPLAVHRALRVKKQIVPSAFYHVGMSYLLRSRLDGKKSVSSELGEICEAVLGMRLDAELVCWDHPYDHHAAAWKSVEGSHLPHSCAHHTSRLGEMLLRAGLELERQDWVDAGVSAAIALMTYHYWDLNDHCTATVSYYPFTRDETINTATDVAALLSLVPSDARPAGLQARVDGVVRMALSEQQPDGSWYYCTSRHYARSKDRRFIDNHHSAQVLQALGKILHTGTLQPDLENEVRTSIRRGLEFYLSRFYNSAGKGTYFPDPRSRSAHIVGYTEGIAAIYWAFRSGSLKDGPQRSRSLKSAASMLQFACRLVDRNTGDVACTTFFGRNYHIQSLRWGSGPMMEAIMYALLLQKETASGA